MKVLILHQHFKLPQTGGAIRSYYLAKALVDEEVQTARDTKSAIRTFIKELPEEQKQVLIMRHYLQMSFQEIADKTGVSINTALGRMRYALINLRKKMLKSNVAYDKNFYPKRFDQIPIPRDLGGGIEGDQ